MQVSHRALLVSVLLASLQLLGRYSNRSEASSKEVSR